MLALTFVETAVTEVPLELTPSTASSIDSSYVISFSSSESAYNDGLGPSGAVLVLSLRRLIITGPELCSRFIAVFDCRRRPAVSLEAWFESRLIKLVDLFCDIASLMAFEPGLVYEIIDSGRSKDVGKDSASRPLGPSGEACTELLFVISWFNCGDIMGDCCRLEVTEEELTAEVGTEADEVMVDMNDVWSFVLTRREVEDSRDAIANGCIEEAEGGGGGGGGGICGGVQELTGFDML